MTLTVISRIQLADSQLQTQSSMDSPSKLVLQISGKFPTNFGLVGKVSPEKIVSYHADSKISTLDTGQVPDRLQGRAHRFQGPAVSIASIFGVTGSRETTHS
jgi:hypothetical protein